MRAREKIARKIEKTSESIRKKHRALKTDRIEEDRYFKSIIKPLQQIIDSPVHAIKRQSRDDNAASASKRERKEEEEEEEEREREKASEMFRDPRKSDRTIVFS